MIVIVVICVFLVISAALWFSALRTPLLRQLTGFHRYPFTCKIQLLTDESKPLDEETYFSVQMIGRIPIPCDRMDTNISVELADITDSRFLPEPVFSVDERFRTAEQPDFYFVRHNGIIPNRKTVISPWKTIVTIPAHHLRFACRGRRKLLFKVSVLSCETGEVLAADQQSVEYIFHRDGYRQLRDRKVEILKASIQLAAAINDNGSEHRLKSIFRQWLNQKAQDFPAAAQLAEWVESLSPNDFQNTRQAVDSLQAYAEQSDKLSAVELALQTAALSTIITTEQFTRLSETAGRLHIKQERFLALCQKIFLFTECRFQNPAVLLGIEDSLEPETCRIRLNEEYRKWNARVTHPNSQIRDQADQMLRLIADLRSSRITSEIS